MIRRFEGFYSHSSSETKDTNAIKHCDTVKQNVARTQSVQKWGEVEQPY